MKSELLYFSSNINISLGNYQIIREYLLEILHCNYDGILEGDKMDTSKGTILYLM